ncbi:unnamed protein product [Caenorhabditis angaria]|uniref:Uncharacterized protein n=1 Tax=Caenorhabditis angaria TaxID=860376 RepID=A0A9P1N1J5_9PELO|nr:unnamed protein product [Caenorhabditis angaria]
MLVLTTENVLRLVKFILNEEKIPDISTEGLEDSDGLQDYDLNKLLKSIYDKVKRIGEFYDSVDVLKDDIAILEKVPGLLRLIDSGRITENYLETVLPDVLIHENKQEFMSKFDFTMYFRNFLDDMDITSLAKLFVKTWFISKLNRSENVYEIIPFSIWEDVLNSLENNGVARMVPEKIEFKHFLCLREYFDHDPKTFDDFVRTHFTEICQRRPIVKNQKFYQHSYGNAITHLETIRITYSKFTEIFNPFPPSITSVPSKNRLPILRIFGITLGGGYINLKSELFIFTKELENALKILLGKEVCLQDEAKCEEYKKHGILLTTSFEKYKNIIKSFGVKEEDFIIFNACAETASNMICVPITSSYGTHCKPSAMAYKEIIDYLVNHLQIFQYCTASDFHITLYWIFSNVDLLNIMQNMSNWTMIECWKIEKIKKAAKDELEKYKTTSKRYQVPLQKSYTKSEAMKHVKNLLHPMTFNSEVFRLCFAAMSEIEKSKTTLKDLYWMYSSCFEKSTLQFWQDSSWKQIMKRKPENQKIEFESMKNVSAPKLNTAFPSTKKGFLNPKKTDIFEEVARKISEISFKTLAYFSNTEFQPISEFEKLLEKPDFRQVFNEKNFEYLKNTIFKDKEKTKKLMKKLEDLFEIEENDEKLMIKKRTSYKVDPMKMKIIEEIEENEKKKIEIEKENEKEKMMENMKVENLEMKKNIEELRKQLENIKNEAENERKIFHEEISLKNGENLKIAENLENSKKELKQVRKELKETRGTYSKIVEENQKEIGNLKKETRKMKENQENEKKKYEKEMKLKEKENMEISGKLQRLEENSEKLNSKIKSLEKDLRNAKNSAKIEMENNLKVIERNMNEAETSKKYLENEKENMKKRLKQLLDEKVEENGKIEELSKENKKLREKLANNSEKMKKFEDWFENGIDKMRRTSKNQEKLRKYERILKIDYETIIDEISSKLNELIRKFPENSEILSAKNEIEKFDENLENYMEKIREEIRKIERNLEGEYEENEDIQEFPNQEFMQKYQEWVEKYL